MQQDTDAHGYFSSNTQQALLEEVKLGQEPAWRGCRDQSRWPEPSVPSEPLCQASGVQIMPESARETNPCCQCSLTLSAPSGLTGTLCRQNVLSPSPPRTGMSRYLPGELLGKFSPLGLRVTPH